MLFFKSVFSVSRFKKWTQGGKQKNIFCKGEILKKNFAEGKTKLAYFAGVTAYLPNI
jgi:hypothetical protein